MKNSVDVVVTLHNGKKWIEATIDSIKNQSLKVERIIVINDRSSDGSDKLAASLQDVEVYNNDNEQGAAPARNFGLKKSNAEFIAFMDQDDLWHPDHLKFLVKALVENPKAGLAGSLCKSFLDGSEPIFKINDYKSEIIDPWKNFPYLWIDCMPSLTLFRREVVDEIKWDNALSGIADYAIWMKVAVKHEIIRVHNLSTAWRRHNSSMLTACRKNPLNYVKKMKQVIDVILPYRTSIVNDPETEILYRKRSIVMHLIYCIILAIDSNNEILFKLSAEELEKVFANDDILLAKRFFKEIIAFFSPETFNDVEVSQSLAKYAKIIEWWPAKNKITLSYLYETIIFKRPGRKFIMKIYFSNPLRLKNCKFILCAFSQKFLKLKEII